MMYEFLLVQAGIIRTRAIMADITIPITATDTGVDTEGSTGRLILDGIPAGIAAGTTQTITITTAAVVSSGQS